MLGVVLAAEKKPNLHPHESGDALEERKVYSFKRETVELFILQYFNPLINGYLFDLFIIVHVLLNYGHSEAVALHDDDC